GADGHAALARIDIENLRRIRGRNTHELVDRESPRPDAVMPQHFHAVLDPGRAIRNPPKVVPARGLLWGAEAAMVGRRSLQVAGLQAAPQGRLVLGGTKRWTHDMRRGTRK